MNSFNDGVGKVSFANTYDGIGRLQGTTATSIWNDSQHPTSLFSAASQAAYSPAGALQQWSLGASLSLARTYDAKSRILTETVTGQH